MNYIGTFSRETHLKGDVFDLYEKGAFTGATAMRLGKFELAHHGTIDDIPGWVRCHCTVTG